MPLSAHVNHRQRDATELCIPPPSSNDHDIIHERDRPRTTTNVIMNKRTVITTTSTTSSSTAPLLRKNINGKKRNNNEIDYQSMASSYTSRHRQMLDHIRSDSVQSRRYPVVPQFLDDDDDDYSTKRSIHTTTGTGSSRRRYNPCDSSSDEGGRGVQKWICDIFDWLEVILPMWKWLKGYKWRDNIVHDIIAGVTVGVMVIPQSMSYAKLAGLPVEYGLYSALFPIYAYAMFGSSRQLAVGPVAMISLLMSTGLTGALSKMGYDRNINEDAYRARYNQMAVQTSFFVGLIYIVMGLSRMGFVTILLSHAVVSGFTTGAAIIIGLSQVKYILGTNAARSDRLYEIIHNLMITMDQFNYKTFFMGTTATLMLIGFKHISKTYPRFIYLRAVGPLLVTTISIILVVIFDFDRNGIPVVGTIPVGLPHVTIDNWFHIQQLNTILRLVGGIVVVGFMESISIAKQLASKHKYEINASSELLGLGVANLVGGIFQAYPVTGSFSRSAVNNDTGARSGISGIITATLVGFVLLVLTPVFERLPLNILAAVVISAVIGLLDYPEAIYLYKVHKFDLAVWVVAFLGTMFLGVEIGLAIAVSMSMFIVLYESAYPHTAILGRLPGTAVYRNIEQYPDAERYDGIVMVRIDAPLYFANARNVRDTIRLYRLAAEAALQSSEVECSGRVDGRCHNTGGSTGATTVRYVIIEMCPVIHLDTSALHILEDMVTNYRSRGQQICFSNPNLTVMQRMVRSGFADRLGRHYFFACLHDAVSYCLQEMESEDVSVHESQHGRHKKERVSRAETELSSLISHS